MIDGDTIRLNGTSIRLVGIDAPETMQPCTDAAGKEYRCGRAAKAALVNLMKGAGITKCKPTGTDRYGRTLAYCWVGAVPLNEQMVHDGWAWAFIKYSTEFTALEQTARAAQRGLWAGRRADPPWEWRAGKVEAAKAEDRRVCAIKGNISRNGEHIYYLPWQTLYARTKIDVMKGERWFCNENEAMNAGWRRALR